MTKTKVLLQASSRSWAGGVDICMGMVEEEITVVRTLKRIFEHFPEMNVTLIAPEFDRGGELDAIVNSINQETLSIYYGHDDSPLNRMIDASKELSDDDYLIRIDGIHFCFDFNASYQMLELAQKEQLDCIKLPDDFPVHFTSEIYRVGALRSLDKKLISAEDKKFRIHPKSYFVMNSNEFNFKYLPELPTYSDEYLTRCRKLATAIYEIPRQEVNDKRVVSGDRLGFHYELALKHIKKSMKVLDIACADGFGVRMMAQQLNEVHGADLDPESINVAKNLSTAMNTKFFVEDVTSMSFDSSSYDAVTSFETLEHVPENACLEEIKRILKPGGMLVLSTPQNSIGNIPVNSCHLIEYSLKQLINLVSKYFIIIKVIGIKAGIIIDENDPYGTNTVLICIKPHDE